MLGNSPAEDPVRGSMNLGNRWPTERDHTAWSDWVGTSPSPGFPPSGNTAGGSRERSGDGLPAGASSSVPPVMGM